MSKNMNTRIATEQDKLTIGEFLYFKRLITELYPTGIVSIVSDTWDFWNVLTNSLPKLKNDILNRDGRVVVRPDSGDPVKIICGDPEADPNSPEYKGAYQLLGEIFGYTTNEQGYKVLDTQTGQLSGFQVSNPEIYKGEGKSICVIDDLCDGGGTFIGIAQRLRELDPNVKLSIKITHTIQRQGLQKLLDHYDHVETTNSYKDWLENEKLKVIDVCSKSRML